MLHEQEKANPQQTIERTRAAIGTLAHFATELGVIRKGMAPTPERQRLETILAMVRDLVAALHRKVTLLIRDGAI